MADIRKVDMVSEHWRNCDFETSDAEIARIDALEKRLRTEEHNQALKIRRLITSFEACHHNSLRWAERIAQAIAEGVIPPTSGRKRSAHPVSIAHLNLREFLINIADDDMEEHHHGEIPGIDTKSVVESFRNLPQRKRWLITLILDNLEKHLYDAGLIPAMRTEDNRMFAGANLDVEKEEEASVYFLGYAVYYRYYKDMVIRMVDDMHPSEKERWVPLLLAVQFANPCSVNYFQFVSVLLDMLGGKEDLEFPFPFCGHYSKSQYLAIRKTIRAYQSFLARDGDTGDAGLFGRLDDEDLSRRWLAASFEKTLRLQLGE
jgi:hypothetical protein